MKRRMDCGARLWGEKQGLGVGSIAAGFGRESGAREGYGGEDCDEEEAMGGLGQSNSGGRLPYDQGCPWNGGAGAGRGTGPGVSSAARPLRASQIVRPAVGTRLE